MKLLIMSSNALNSKPGTDDCSVLLLLLVVALLLFLSGLGFWEVEYGGGDGVGVVLNVWVVWGFSSVLTDDVLNRGGEAEEAEGGVVTMMGLGTMVVWCGRVEIN